MKLEKQLWDYKEDGLTAVCVKYIEVDPTIEENASKEVRYRLQTFSVNKETTIQEVKLQAVAYF